MSKGSKPRPTDLEKFANNHDSIFGKKTKKATKKVKEDPTPEDPVPQWVKDCWKRDEALKAERKAERARRLKDDLKD